MKPENKKILIGVCIGVALCLSLLFVVGKIVSNYNQMVIENYGEYLVSEGLVVIEGVNENNVTGIGEVTLEYLIGTWAGNIENQAGIVSLWLEDPGTRELIIAEVCNGN